VAGKYFGAALKRREDPRMLRGEAQFTADLTLPGMLHMAILRSPHGRGSRRSTRTRPRQCPAWCAS